MDLERFPEIIKEIYQLSSELEKMFEGRHFTPDGHMMGSIGEVLAAYYYGLQLCPASTKGHDAIKNGKEIEIKATQSTSVGFRFSSDVAPPEFVLVLKINKDGHFSEIYNGKGASIWEQLRHKKVPSNGQVRIGLKKLKELNVLVANHDRIQRIIN